MMEPDNYSVVLFTKDDENAIMPSIANNGDAGMDLCSIDTITVDPGKTAIVSTGLKVQLPEHTVGMVCSRSGLAAKNHVFVLNAPGIVDAGYRGVIKVILHNAGNQPFVCTPGMRIAQLVIVPFVFTNLHHNKQVAESSARGESGFGSSGV